MPCQKSWCTVVRETHVVRLLAKQVYICSFTDSRSLPIGTYFFCAQYAPMRLTEMVAGGPMQLITPLERTGRQELPWVFTFLGYILLATVGAATALIALLALKVV
jgi:hypothetical protein